MLGGSYAIPMQQRYQYKSVYFRLFFYVSTINIIKNKISLQSKVRQTLGCIQLMTLCLVAFQTDVGFQFLGIDHQTTVGNTVQWEGGSGRVSLISHVPNMWLRVTYSTAQTWQDSCWSRSRVKNRPNHDHIKYYRYDYMRPASQTTTTYLHYSWHKNWREFISVVINTDVD